MTDKVDIEVLILDDQLDDNLHNAACSKVKRYAQEVAKVGKIREARTISQFKDRIIESKSEQSRAFILAFIDYSGPGDTAMAIPALEALLEEFEESRLMTVLMSNLKWPNEDIDAEKIFGQWVAKGGQSYVAKASVTDKDLGPHYLANTFATARKMATLWADNEGLRGDQIVRSEMAKTQCKMLGNSKAIKNIKELVLQIANSKLSVLLQGESGTGKQVVASAIHYASDRAGRLFIEVNCGAFTETLLESELFGYVKGAFSGAASDRKGLFESAHKSTIFLDEIGATTSATQIRLLRVLQEQKVRPVGANFEKEIDVRVIAATNSDLERAIAEGTFREDLYYRLKGMPIRVPPLRERIEDLPNFTEHFLNSFGMGKGKRISSEALEVLMSYPWPGNIRELKSVIERMAILAKNEEIGVSDIPEDILRSKSKTVSHDAEDWSDLRAQVALRHPEGKSELVEKRIRKRIRLSEEENRLALIEGFDVVRKRVYGELLIRVMERTGGDIGGIMKILGSKSVRTFQNTFQEFGINVEKRGGQFVTINRTAA